MDLEALRQLLQTPPEELLQNEQALMAIGRMAVVVVAALLASALTWFSTRLGWGTVKMGGRGLRRLCRGKPGDPLVNELFHRIDQSMGSLPQPGCKLRKAILFTRGDLDLDNGAIRLGGENITALFSRRQQRHLLRRAREISATLQSAADRKHKQQLLYKFAPDPTLAESAFEGEPLIAGAQRLARLRTFLDDPCQTTAYLPDQPS